jgi:hypothetical protein
MPRLWDSGARRYAGDITRIPGTPYDVVTESEADAQVAAGWATRLPPATSPDAVPPTATVDTVLDALKERLARLPERPVPMPAPSVAVGPAQRWSRASMMPAPSGIRIDSGTGLPVRPDGTVISPSSL